jgi:TonB family protein
MGVPGGTPGASNYTGVPGGGGTSIGHSISGRNIVSRPDPKAEFREGGKVVIRVTVNRDGAIIDSRIVSAANATIRALALKKLQSVRFNKSPTAPAEQFGNITFNFKATRK